ncbi:MAG TPA: hypothetical protein VIP11_18990, partial [Gemmatimonadaceae bacterium]
TPSVDEKTGEKDVERYAIYRRLSSVATFDVPFASIPANGATTYSFVDTDVIPGQTWIYGVTSQDCTLEITSVMGETTQKVIP